MPKRTIATCGPDNRADASFAKKAMKPKSVAEAVMSAVERRRLEQFVPRWLGQTVVVRHLLPPLYRSGVRRSFRQELAGLNASRP